MAVQREARVDIADLMRRPGSRRDLDFEIVLDDFESGGVKVRSGSPVRASLALEPTAGGVVAHGDCEAEWSADCARCVDPIDGLAQSAVDELFEADPVEGETYPIDGTDIDLEPMLRDLLIVEFPLVPAPPVRADRCTRCGRTSDEIGIDEATETHDPRWDVLDDLDLGPAADAEPTTQES